MNPLLFIQPARSVWSVGSGEELALLVLMLIVLLGLLLVAGVAIYLLVILQKALNPAPQPVESRTLWQRFTGLRPIHQEKELVMDHAYDGIVELDNPTPPWFMSLFYGTIGFGVVYLAVFHVFGGDLQLAEYQQEVAVAEVQRDAYIRRVAGSINENTVRLVSDTKSLDAGKAVFLQNCVACHGQQGQGGVGPNLTDAYWLHGGTVRAVFHTITAGVPEKGMMAWSKQLNPLQIQQLTGYILSLQGSNPAGAKEAQGTKEIASR